MKRKKWSVSEKLDILEKARLGDVVTTCRENGVSSATFYYWRKQFESKGEAGLSGNYGKKTDKELKEANEKVRLLSKLLAEKEVELEMQRELLKKKFGTSNLKEI